MKFLLDLLKTLLPQAAGHTVRINHVDYDPTALAQELAKDLEDGVVTDEEKKRLVALLALVAATGQHHGSAGVVVTPPPPVPVVTEPPAPTPAPLPSRTVSRVRLKLERAQYPRPENRPQYAGKWTDGGMALFEPDYFQQVASGQSAAPYGSALWFDLTAFDQFGVEFQRDAVLAYGLAFHTELRIGAAFIRGAGAVPGTENPLPYQAQDSSAIVNTQQAWHSSLGFLHRVETPGEGEFTVSGSVAGVSAPPITIRIS